MYNIKPETLKAFIDNPNIKLPRFQRKQTWDDRKNFLLCISIFKEYPIGVSIQNIEPNGRSKRWLLDGRQRRNALIKISSDPENIYNWAKSFIKFKNRDQLHEIEEKFWEEINNYIEMDEITDENADVSEIIHDDTIGDDSETNTHIDNSTKGLDFLLEIIKLIHNKSRKHSGFTKPFDFSNYISNLPYVQNTSNGITFNSKKLRTFINEFITYCNNEDIEYLEKDSFIQFLFSRYQLDEYNRNKIKSLIIRNWNAIHDRIIMLEKIDDILRTSYIGLIEIKDISSVDAQKIFNIINSGGTKLTAVEILSAKPSWNTKVVNPSSQCLDFTKNMYKSIDIQNTDVVKWDLPATLIRRIDNLHLIFKEFSDKKVDFETEITLGFKILAGIYEQGVKKSDIEKLSKNRSINWNSDIDEFIHDVNDMIKLISSSMYFKYFKSWRISILEILSDSTALNFVLVLYKDWVRKDKPIGSNTKSKQFQKNAFILFDKLIFEYVTKQWRGSSDSKIARNLENLSNEADIFTPISSIKWKNLLNEIFDKNSIDEDVISLQTMKPLLYHFYCLNKLQGPDTQYSIEVDHIIPQTAFDNSTIENNAQWKHNLFNLGLLPKDENSSKGNKSLIQITDSWLIDQIFKYEFISENHFPTYSNINNWVIMKEQRKQIFTQVYNTNRTNFLNN